jgi:probable H4MPT-linked C1 transfer pathway protein
MSVVGFDIGGVNTKIARVFGGEVMAARSRPFELQRDPSALVPLLRELVTDAGLVPDSAFPCAVTMTAELSQMFRTKRDGVAFVIDAVEAALPSSDIRIFAVDGQFLSPAAARTRPLAVAAANWVATARIVAARQRDALLIDVGTTTTDVIPIVDGKVAAEGWTDPDRLASGELVYSGALRTPVEAIVQQVPYRGGTAAVSAEGFALIGDAHLWRGTLASRDYTVPTPDGRPATRECSGERLARVICADRDLLDDVAISEIAAAIAGAQITCVTRSVRRVRARHSSLHTAVVAGLGAFIGEAAARAAGLDVVYLASALGEDPSRCAPAAAVALLLGRQLVGA